MRNKVLMILIGNIRYDGRVLKTINTLIKNGYNVELICTEFDSDDSFEKYKCKIHYIKRKSGGGFLLQLIRSMKFFFVLRKVIKNINPNFIHCNDLCSTIYVLGLFDKYKIIFDSHELSLDLYHGIKKTIYIPIERHVVKCAYKIILPQIDRLNIFFFKYKDVITKDKLFLVENFPIKNNSEVSSSFFSEFYGFNRPKSNIIISYTGVIQKERKLDIVIRCMKNIQKAYLFIIGPADAIYLEYLNNIIVSEGLTDRVFIKKPIHNKNMLSVAASSDIGICLYGGLNINSYFCASNKIFEYLNMGVKVITNSSGGSIRIVNHKKNGYLINDITEDEISSAIECLRKNNFKSSSFYYWENQESVFLKIYK